MTQDERREMMAARRSVNPVSVKEDPVPVSSFEAPKSEASETPITSEEKPAKKDNKESIKVGKYYGPSTVSHLMVFLVSLILVVAMVLPYIPFVWADGLEFSYQPNLVSFPAVLGLLQGWSVPDFFMPSMASSGYIGIIGSMFQIADPNVITYVTTAIYGVGLVFLATAMIYSFVCLVGGIGRKEGYKLAYVSLAGGLLIYLLPFATMIYEFVETETVSIMPYPSIVAIVLLIAMVVVAHVLYAKRIKYTVNDKELEEYKAKADDKIGSEELNSESQPSTNPEFDALMKEFEEAEAKKEANEAPQVQAETPVVTPVTLVKEEPAVAEVKPEPVITPAPIKEKVEEVKPAPIKTQTKVTFDVSKGLPEDIKELGDHQFSKNLDLEVAIIPEGIDKIGPACFANCLNLKTVYIPSSVTKISFNAFFACKKLVKINYGGTKVEWKQIVRGSNWLTSAGTKVVICKDGAVSVNPFH